MRYNTLNLWDLLKYVCAPTNGWCLNWKTTTYKITLPLKLCKELLLLGCHCITTLLHLLLGSLSNIMPHLATSKTSHSSHVLLMLLTMSSRLLLLGPKLGPLLGLHLSFSHKGKINLIPILNTLMLTGRSRTTPSLLLNEIILEPLPTGYMLMSHDTMDKTLP